MGDNLSYDILDTRCIMAQTINVLKRRLNMAKFLGTSGISYHLEELIHNANEKLILISPFLQFNDHLKQSLEEKDRQKTVDVRLIYGESKLQPAENNWLKSLMSIRTSICPHLHAKCYLNEQEAIITSMNLYEYSQVNNNEMGILIDKTTDGELYTDILADVNRLIRISQEIKVTVATVPKNDDELIKKTSRPVANGLGKCIRCGEQLKLNPMVPYCPKCYSSYKKSKKDEAFEEKYCHICGTPNKSSLAKPTCWPCYKSNKDKLDFPLQKT